MTEDQVRDKFREHYEKVQDSVYKNYKLDIIIDLLAMAEFCDKWAKLHIKYDFIDNGFSMQELQTLINSKRKKDEKTEENENDTLLTRGHLSLVVSNDSPEGPRNYPSTTREI